MIKKLTLLCFCIFLFQISDAQEVCLTIEANPNPTDPALSGFTKYIDVFGIGIYAESTIADEKVKHVAAIFAEWLDNDEDGVADDPNVLNALTARNAIMPILSQEGSAAENALFNNYTGNGIGAVCFDEEIITTRPLTGRFDASVEESLHTISAIGYANAYPDVFAEGANSNSLLTQAMDVARGGRFTTIPNPYPAGAWYSYDDETCDYNCMATEYFYWGLTSMLGIQDYGDRCSEIANEWRACTADQFQSMDSLLFELFSNPTGYVIPTKAPDGKYCPSSTTVDPDPDMTGANPSDFNLTLLSTLDEHTTGDFPISYNDVWGYVDQSGKEYAILGTTTGTAIIDVSDPVNPNEVAFIPGSFSIWRDMFHNGNYIYATADQGEDGLLIINMTDPENITHAFWKPMLTVNGETAQLATCHNLFIDENGYCYLAGCSNINNGGFLILDIFTNPDTPVLVGQGPAVYSHDLYVRGDTLWSSDIEEGVFSVWDVSNKMTPVMLGSNSTTSNFSHNSWLSDDGKVLFTTDEVPFASVDAYDVSDLSDIKLLDTYRPEDTKEDGVIPHNTHYNDGWVITSWYTDGLKVVDAHRPDNMIEVASYDTHPQPIDLSFEQGPLLGCWGAFPFLPSGIILASDEMLGLHIFQPNYDRACYLEGTVVDMGTGNPIEGVTIEIQASQINAAQSSLEGSFKTGLATAGTYDITFSHPNYASKTVSAELINGEVVNLSVELGQLTSTSELATENQLNLFPNPAANFVQIEWETGFEQEATLFVVDELGRTIYKEIIPNGSKNIQLNTSNFTSGVFWVRLTDGVQSIAKKVILE